MGPGGGRSAGVKTRIGSGLLLLGRGLGAGDLLAEVVVQRGDAAAKGGGAGGRRANSAQAARARMPRNRSRARPRQLHSPHAGPAAAGAPGAPGLAAGRIDPRALRMAESSSSGLWKRRSGFFS